MKYTIIFFIGLNFFSLNAQTNLKWLDVLPGISYLNTETIGENIFIGYGGWSAKPEAVKFWCEKLFYANLQNLKVNKVFAVKGPDSPCYDEREIADSLLAIKLLDICKNENITNIIIAAHSSGSFVAHHFFQYLFGTTNLDSLGIIKNKIIYFNLDGGIGSGECGFPIDENIASKLNSIYAVYAYDSTTNKYSSNYETMILLSKKFTNSYEIRLDVSDCGCTGKWCIHDALIIKKPYNPEKFDLVNDYGGINDERPVQSDYLNVLKTKKPN